MTRKLPVFFHIPKNAGTYISNIALPCLRQYITETGLDIWEWYHLDVRRENNTYYRIVGYKKSNMCLGSKYVRQSNLGNSRISFYNVDISNLSFNDFIPFAITLVDNGLTKYRSDIYSILPPDIMPYEFTCLREPYSRIQSIYSYTQSHQSSHEPYHNAYAGMSFIDYLNSSLLEGSWLIRCLLDIPNEVPITQEHFVKVCKLLDNMLICDVSKVFDCICRVYRDCYNLDVSDSIKHHEYTIFNRTKDKVDIPFCSLDLKTQTAFNNQTLWDKKIYTKYIC